MRKERNISMPGIGISSLVVIFAVLCLTVFALLSISTVQASGRLASSSRDAIVAYYEADCAAEEILAQLRNGEVPQGVRCEDGLYYFDCPIREGQVLRICVALDGRQYRVLRWQAVSTRDWQTEDDLPVWDGQ